MKQTLTQKFISEISKIKNPEVFLGVARLLKVKLVEDQKDENNHFISRDFIDIFSDTIEQYDKSARKMKKELLKILRVANSKEVLDADRTENSEGDSKNEEV